ncbi:MAG: hypothetical protein KGL39_04380 [Patescibacteria group bacterium]|nr:hypothetical protein [Patescibacteria group bacterium]
MGKRMEPPETVDNVTHLLHRLQSDGWGVAEANLQFEYGTLDGDRDAVKSPPGKRKLPYAAVVTVRLLPT